MTTNADLGARYVNLPPLHLIQLFSCSDCGAVVADRVAHDAWHLTDHMHPLPPNDSSGMP
jgi:hypothetical protein